jgi:hypothetical protein
LSTPDEPVVIESGALVVESLLQWGSRATSLAVVERSVLIEQASVERHGKVSDSVLGSNTHVAAGEVSACLLGPFVGCHHQSLLISTHWPEGRGNVAYGANVGSNHTSRAPDQEFRAGEGLFLGLGVNVKFPCDFSEAAYTAVACAVNLPPQRVTFPFSLVSLPQERFDAVPLTFNQISPGWMLRENLYALRRCELKFRARDRARRGRLDYAVFRRETVKGMRAAALRLDALRERRDVYTERDIPGLGKNVMTEKDRLKAVEAYRFHAGYFALRGLLERVRVAMEIGRDIDRDIARLLDSPAGDEAWEFQRQILVHDCGVTHVADGLCLLVAAAQRVARDTQDSREKDAIRGVRVIDDYGDVHPPTERDRVVRLAWEEADQVQADVEEILRRVETGPGVAAPMEARISRLT